VTRSLAAASIALGLWLAGAAAQAETKTYMGSQCMPANSFDQPRLQTGFVTNEIRATADGTTVACPVIKGVINNSEIASVTITVNLTSARKVSCDLYAMRAYIPNTSTSNQIQHVVSPNTTSPAGTSTITMPIMTSGGGTAWPSDNKFKYYELFCTLNNGDRIRSYQVNETGTDSQYTRIYPNTMCRFEHSELGEDSRYLFEKGQDSSPGGYVRAVGETGFSNGGEFQMVCPVIGDHGTGNGGTVRARLAVTHPDVSGSKMTCTFYQNYAFGLPIASISRQVTGDGSEYPSYLLDMNLPSAGARTWSRYHIRCAAPGNGDARILGYAIEEK
jgi:hypothetical protein